MSCWLGASKLRVGWILVRIEVRGSRRAIMVQRVRRFDDLGRRLAGRIVITPEAVGKHPLMRRMTVRTVDACFGALNGGRTLGSSNRTLAGRKERWALLQGAYPGLPLPRPPQGASEADVLDALVLVWAAQGRPSSRNRRLRLV